MAEYYFEDFEYTTYQNDIIDSQGFYVSNDVGLKIPCGIRRVSRCDGAAYKKAEAAARYAIEKHNNEREKNAGLVFREILNLNEQPTAGKIYYITMAAAEDSPGAGEGFSCYQAKVWEKISGRYRVDEFRLAPFHAASSTDSYLVLFSPSSRIGSDRPGRPPSKNCILRVNGCSCEECCLKLRKLFLKVDGVKSVGLDEEKKWVLIRGDADPIKLVRALNLKGREAEIMYYCSLELRDNTTPDYPAAGMKTQQPNSAEKKSAAAGGVVVWLQRAGYDVMF
nr:polyadenylate-binding protein rbp45 [Ipomoea batatas]